MSPTRARVDPVTARLALGLAAVLAFLVALELFPVAHPWFEPVNVRLARATEWLLEHMAIPVSREGAVLTHPDGFAYRITYVCSGLRPIALIAVTVLLAPATRSWRLAGLLLGVAGVEALNLCRLVHLYWVGVFDPDGFILAHRVIWNAIAVAMVAGFLLWWLHAGRRRQSGLRGRVASAHAAH